MSDDPRDPAAGREPEVEGAALNDPAAGHEPGVEGAAPDDLEGGESPPEGAPEATTGAAAEDPSAAAERERDELRETLQRVQADFENFRKRVMRDQATQAERAHSAIVDQLLPVLDSFELAVLNIPSAELAQAGQKLKKGVELVYAELLAVLERAGLERIEALGKSFDPEEHEAVMRDDGEGTPVVTEVMREGYRLKGRVLRPAMVRVGPGEADAEASEGG